MLKVTDSRGNLEHTFDVFIMSFYIRVASLYNVPSGSRADLHARPEGPSLMGRMGRVGRVGRMGRNIKSVLLKFSYFVRI